MKMLLLLLVMFTGITASVCGLLLVASPDGIIIGMPEDLLAGTPFKNFMLPGVILFAGVGLVNLVAGVQIIGNKQARYQWTLAGGVMVVGWIMVQLVMLQSILWMQLVYLFIGLSILLLSYQLQKKWIV